MLAAAVPLSAQAPPPPAVPILDGVLLKAPLPRLPDSNAQVQQAIEKMLPTIPTGREVLAMDLDSVLLVSAAKSLSVVDDVEVRKLVSGLKSIQIRSFEIEGAEPEVYQRRIQSIRDVLKEPLWARYARQTSAQGEMEIWSGRLGNTPTGVLLLSISGKQVFIMNVAGNIRPDQLIFLSGALGIPKFMVNLDRH
jgi:hypothetical protein